MSQHFAITMKNTGSHPSIYTTVHNAHKMCLNRVKNFDIYKTGILILCMAFEYEELRLFSVDLGICHDLYILN